MKRVLLVAPLPPPYGGIAHWTTMVLRHSKNVDRIPLQVIDTALRHRSVFDKSFASRVLRGIPELFKQLVRVFRQLPNDDVLALHITTSGQFSLARDVVLLLAAKLFRKRSILHIRSGRLPGLLKAFGLRPFFLRIALRIASHVIVIDEFTAQAVGSTIAPAKLSKIPNCIDMSVLPNIPARKSQTVLFVGWVIPEKGIEELLGAWASISRHDWQLKIIGPYSSEYAAGLRERHDLQRVEVTGEIENSKVLVEMASAELLCLPSYTEGFPNVVLEAMALQCGVVATSVGAIPELLAGGAGALVPQKDQVALAKRLVSLIDDSIARYRMVDRAKDKVAQEYSIEHVYKLYEAVWKGERVG